MNPGQSVIDGHVLDPEFPVDCIVHLEADGVLARGCVQQSDGELVVRLYSGRAKAGRFLPGALFEVQRAVAGGSLVAQVTVLAYHPDEQVLHVSAPTGAARLERRDHRRIEVRIGACVLHDRRLTPELGWSVDISPGGASLDLPESLMEPGDHCEIWLRVPEGAPVQVQAVLIAAADVHRVQFGEIPPGQEERLLRFLLRTEAAQRRQAAG